MTLLVADRDRQDMRFGVETRVTLGVRERVADSTVLDADRFTRPVGTRPLGPLHCLLSSSRVLRLA
jgi:hypothetical protein